MSTKDPGTAASQCSATTSAKEPDRSQSLQNVSRRLSFSGKRGNSPSRPALRRQTTTLPVDPYLSHVGPGSYNSPPLFGGEHEAYKSPPAFSMAGRHSTKGLFIPLEFRSMNYGRESPGVGRYNACAGVQEAKKGVVKIGTGPKCPASNFCLPSISPGPACEGECPSSIESRIKARRSVFCVVGLTGDRVPVCSVRPRGNSCCRSSSTDPRRRPTAFLQSSTSSPAVLTVKDPHKAR